MSDELRNRLAEVSQGLSRSKLDVETVKRIGRRRQIFYRTATIGLSLALALGAWFVGSELRLSGPIDNGDVQPAAEGQLDLLFSAPGYPGESTSSSDVYVSTRDGSSTQNLTNSRGSDFYPVWSPDEQSIAFVSEHLDEGNVDIYVMEADGSALRRLTTDPAIDTQPAWSPDGSEIVFSHNDATGLAEIYIVNVQTAQVRQLTNNEVMDEEPSWSPDGSRIAFASDVGGNREIFNVSSSGSDRERITFDEETDSDPTWSPDGTQLAFVRTPSEADEGDIYLVNADGTGLQPVATGSNREYSPSWAPDGTGIVFSVEFDDDEISLFEKSASESAPRDELGPTSVDAAHPDLRS